MSGFIFFRHFFYCFCHSFFQGKGFYDFYLCAKGQEESCEPVILGHVGGDGKAPILLQLNLTYVEFVINPVSHFLWEI